jgi:hypothetical protein
MSISTELTILDRDLKINFILVMISWKFWVFPRYEARDLMRLLKEFQTSIKNGYWKKFSIMP